MALPDFQEEILAATRQVLQLHGGSLPASLLGDELRRRHAELWKSWKSNGETGSLVRLCAASEGFSVEDPCDTTALHNQSQSRAQEPLIRWEGCEESRHGYPQDLHDADKAQEVRNALASRILRREGGNRGPVPVAWLTIACEKELLRHLRLFPSYEQQIAQGLSSELADLLSQGSGTVTSQTAKALRKRRMAYRLVALIADAAETFQLNVDTDVLQSQVRIDQDFCSLFVLVYSAI